MIPVPTFVIRIPVEGPPTHQTVLGNVVGDLGKGA